MKLNFLAFGCLLILLSTIVVKADYLVTPPEEYPFFAEDNNTQHFHPNSKEIYHSERLADYTYHLPHNLKTQEKTILVDPNVHAWGAYAANGKLLRAGRATAGGKWCKDIARSCKTAIGTFRIYSLGDDDCYSSKYPLGEGGAPMPYCMFFSNGQGLHGSNEVIEANVSHGCVRIRIGDAKWLRYHFAKLGTKVVVKAY